MTDLKPDDLEPLRDISKDGPHLPSDHRRWLARKLMDSNLSDAEAYDIVARSPDVSAAYGLRTALNKIATGDGYYGQQAREYKNIAREALGLPPL